MILLFIHSFISANRFDLYFLQFSLLFEKLFLTSSPLNYFITFYELLHKPNDEKYSCQKSNVLSPASESPYSPTTANPNQPYHQNRWNNDKDEVPDLYITLKKNEAGHLIKWWAFVVAKICSGLKSWQIVQQRRINCIWNGLLSIIIDYRLCFDQISD